MSIKHSSVTVGTAATSLTASVHDTTGNNDDVARSALVTNEGSVAIYLGGTGVTTSAYGFKLIAGASVALDLDREDELFAVSGTAGQVVRILHTGV